MLLCKYHITRLGVALRAAETSGSKILHGHSSLPSRNFLINRRRSHPLCHVPLRQSNPQNRRGNLRASLLPKNLNFLRSRLQCPQEGFPPQKPICILSLIRLRDKQLSIMQHKSPQNQHIAIPVEYIRRIRKKIQSAKADECRVPQMEHHAAACFYF